MELWADPREVERRKQVGKAKLKNGRKLELGGA